MKKILVFLLVFFIIHIVLVSGIGNNKKFSFTVGAGIRNIDAEHFKDIFSGTNLCFSVDMSYRIIKFGECFLHTDYLSIKGELDFTKEKTTFSLIPIEFGFRLLVGKRKFVPYIGIGGGYYMYKDKHPGLETFSENKFGFFGEGGVKINFSNSMFFDLKLKYIKLKSEDETDLGGLAYMGGIGFRF